MSLNYTGDEIDEPVKTYECTVCNYEFSIGWIKFVKDGLFEFVKHPTYCPNCGNRY